MSSDEDDSSHNKPNLATKEYWNVTYTVELNNFNNFGDLGAEWFGHSIGQKMIKGYVFANGEYVGKNVIYEYLSMMNQDHRLAHKITNKHIEVIGSQRQNVKLAAQLFSNSLAKPLLYCGENNYLKSKNWKATSYILQLFNDWFDLFNTQLPKDRFTSSYGLDLEKQNDLLNKMNEFISTMTVHGKNKNILLPFQKGILVSNKSLINLLNSLKLNYNGITYIITRRLNQDVLENLFGYLKGMYGSKTHLSPLDFKYWCIQSLCKMSREDPILDVGCGNALLLTQLAKLGFSNLYGIDYSAPAVKLASSIIAKQNIKNVSLKKFDFLTDDLNTLPTFALVLDKGTYDVIGMNDENKKKRNKYKENIINLLQPNGMFLIVSCNWTQTELNEQFSDSFQIIHIIPTPSYQFGGAVGNTLSATLYKKNV